MIMPPPDAIARLLTQVPVDSPVNSGTPLSVGLPESVPERAALLIVGEVSVLAVSVCVAPSVTTVSLVPGNAKLVESVPVNVSELLAVSVLPFAMVNGALDAGAVNATLLIDVAVATPKLGVVSAMFVAARPLGSVVDACNVPDPL